MPARKRSGKSRPQGRAMRPSRNHAQPGPGEIVLISGMSGSGKGSVLKAFEDLGFYAVENLPVDLVRHFAELVSTSPEIRRAALVIDIREGEGLDRLPDVLRAVRKVVKLTIVYLDADDEVLVRRFSETRRPHPLGTSVPVKASLENERRKLGPVRRVADMTIDTTRFNVHELRALVVERFGKSKAEESRKILVSCISFGFKKGVPEEADLMFDVRFLPNPHFVPEFRPYTGRHPKVAKYIRSFPQTQEFINRISELLVYLLPHYVSEGKSYLTIAFGCTGGQHRSVLIAEEVKKRLAKAGYNVKVVHRDSPKS